MASSLPYVSVELDENDVPGAKLPYADLEKNSVQSLKRFLACRKVDISGKKAALVERVKETILLNKPIHQQVDNGSWLLLKEKKKREALLETTNIQATAPPIFPISSAWKPFPTATAVPRNFCEGHIHAYFVDSCMMRTDRSGSHMNIDDSNENHNEVDNENDHSSSKPLIRGRQYVKSGHVLDLCDSLWQGHYCLKGKVKASYRSTFYHVMVMFNVSGEIVDGSCHCKGSAMGRCSHVAALLFTLQTYILDNETACTSATCAWNKGSQQKKPGLCAERYNSFIDHKARVKYDPRIYQTNPSEDKEKELQLLSQLTRQASAWESLLRLPYEDFTLDQNDIAVLKKQVGLFQDAILFGHTAPSSITSEQGSERWRQLRKLLITASVIKDYHMEKTPQQFFNIVNRHFYSSAIQHVNFIYGNKNEGNARNDYCMYMQSRGCPVTVTETGLWINPTFLGIGASPDGLVIDCSETPSEGLLEIKCPKLLEHHLPSDLSCLTKEQLGRFFCEAKNDSVILKKGHKYYAQVQTQMAVCGRQWCDFVIWTPLGINVERIFYDEDFLLLYIERAMKFHSKILIPEYFLQKVARQLPPYVMLDETEAT